jgi:hypothetical protein
MHNLLHTRFVNLGQVLLNSPSIKTTSLEGKLFGIQHRLAHFDQLFNLYRETPVRKWRRKVHIYKRKELDRIAKLIAGDPRLNCLVAWGNWLNPTGFRSGHMRCPNKMLIAAVNRRPNARVVIVDEYFTSKKCSNCGVRGVDCETIKANLRGFPLVPRLDDQQNPMFHPRTGRPLMVPGEEMANNVPNYNVLRCTGRCSNCPNQNLPCSHGCNSWFGRNVNGTRNILFRFISEYFYGNIPIHLRR